MRNRRCDEDDGADVRRVGSSRFRACAALARVADDIPRRIAGPVAVRPRDCNQRHEKEFLQVSNEETPTTEQPRALALAMRAGGRKKAAPKKKAGRKAAPKKAAAKKKAAARRRAYAQEGRTEEGRPQGRRRRRRPPRRRAPVGRRPAGRKKAGGRKKAAAPRLRRELDAVGRSRFHELSTRRSRLPSWSRAGRKGRHPAPFFLAACASHYPNVVSRSSTCRGVSSRGVVPRSSRYSFAASSSSSAA